jgi:hypothetical protein
MTKLDEIQAFFASQSEPKRGDLLTLHALVMELAPNCQLWYEDGRDADGKVIANPSAGYGCYTIQYANGTSREFYRIGLSANKTGVSVYILGLADKMFLSSTFGATIGKASVTGYCIKFRSLKDVNIDVLREAISVGLRN